MNTQAQKKISRARAGLILVAPFYATLALSMGAVEVDASVTETMATDGKSLFYNAEFVMEISDAQIRGVIVHEMLHVAWLHHTRRGNRDPKLWNVATDYVINANVIREGYELPDGALIDVKRFPHDMPADAVYDILKREQDQNGGQPQQGQPGQGQPGQGQRQIGDILDAAPGQGEAARQAAEMETKAKIINAAKAAAAAGKATSMSKRFLEEARQTPRDIWAVLQRYVDSAARQVSTWSRPNRRYVSRGLYLPGRMPDGMSRLAIVIDVSGSINAAKLATFLKALNVAVEVAGPEAVDVIQCDTKITDRREFGPGELITVDVIGGGGTELSPALAEVKDAAACIVFTDCEFRRDPINPGVPVLWARWGDGAAPGFGEVIDIAA